MSHNGKPHGPDRSEPEIVLRMLRLDKGQQATVRILSNNYKGCLTHWYKGRSHYCPGAEVCDLHKIEPVWKGYCCCEQWVQAASLWEPWVLEITESLDQDFWGRFAAGQVWHLQRTPGKKKDGKGPVVGKLWEERDPTTFPPPFDMRPVLLAVYHVKDVRLDQDNPMPRRMTLKPSADAAPRDPARQAEKTAPPSAEAIKALRDRIRGVGGMTKGIED